MDRISDHRILWDCWRENAGRIPGKDAVVHWVAGEEPYRWKWGALMDAASGYAARLSEAGVRKGDVCAIGYRNNPEKTAEVLKDGWFFSGDFGFRHEGEYYIIGRKKDIINVAGKNVYPEDMEDAIGQVRSVIPGRVVAFGKVSQLGGNPSQKCRAAEYIGRREIL